MQGAPPSAISAAINSAAAFTLASIIPESFKSAVQNFGRGSVVFRQIHARAQGNQAAYQPRHAVGGVFHYIVNGGENHPGASSSVCLAVDQDEAARAAIGGVAVEKQRTRAANADDADFVHPQTV